MKRLFTHSALCGIIVFALLAGFLSAGICAYDDYPNTWVNTGDHCKDIVGIARTQIGVVATDGDHVKYNEWYFGNTSRTVPWCAVFISWCANQAGIPTSIIPKNASARGWTVDTMDTNPFGGTAFTIDQQTPQPGDILFTRTDQTMTSSSHCCLVVDVDDTYIYAIEGNTGLPGAVRIRQYTRVGGYKLLNNVPSKSHYIVFATRPDYDADQAETDYYPFNDVHDSGVYYYEPVLWALENHITSGIDAKHFMPDQNCTRAQVVTFLYRMAGEPEIISSNPFTDVKEGSWYYNAVLWGYENGIVYGFTDDSFKPDRICTRSQVITFLWRYVGSPPAEESAVNPFTDVTEAAYYYDAVLWGNTNQLVHGMSADTFAPDRACTRGQIATFLYRLHQAC